MSDDLDDLERVCRELLVDAECDGLDADEIDRIQAPVSCRWVLEMAERVRRAEKRALYFERQCDSWSRRVESLEAEMKLIDGE